MSPVIAFLNLPGGLEWIIVGAVALLIFGRRLPEVARSLGKSIVEFKRGVRDVHDDVDHATTLDKPAESGKPLPPANKSPTTSESSDQT